MCDIIAASFGLDICKPPRTFSPEFAATLDISTNHEITRSSTMVWNEFNLSWSLAKKLAFKLSRDFEDAYRQFDGIPQRDTPVWALGWRQLIPEVLAWKLDEDGFDFTVPGMGWKCRAIGVERISMLDSVGLIFEFPDGHPYGAYGESANTPIWSGHGNIKRIMDEVLRNRKRWK